MNDSSLLPKGRLFILNNIVDLSVKHEIERSVQWEKMTYHGNPFYDDNEPNTYYKPKLVMPSMCKILNMLIIRLNLKFGLRLNDIAINKYYDNTQGLFWHSDEDCIGDSDMITLSVGASRRIWFRDKETQQEFSFMMNQGDLIYMGSGVQSNYEHCLKPDTDLADGARYAIIFRDRRQCSLAKSLQKKP